MASGITMGKREMDFREPARPGAKSVIRRLRQPQTARELASRRRETKSEIGSEIGSALFLR